MKDVLQNDLQNTVSLKKLGKIANFFIFSKFSIFFLSPFETEWHLRPNLGASRDAPDAPSRTSMGASEKNYRNFILKCTSRTTIDPVYKKSETSHLKR